jgi:uncharacterized LabA/DUF88 family protein
MSVIKHKAQRVGIFIDTQNLYHSAKNLYKSKVNFGAVMKEALAGRVLVRCVAYVIRTESEEEKGFFEALNKIGIETKVKDIRIFAGGAKKADWDIGMAIDAITMAEKLDAVVIATGDGDFVPLLEYLKGRGCQAEVIAFGKSASGQLREAADDFTDMCENPRAYLIGYRGAGGVRSYIPGFAAGDPDEGIDVGTEVYDDSEADESLGTEEEEEK